MKKFNCTIKHVIDGLLVTDVISEVTHVGYIIGSEFQLKTIEDYITMNSGVKYVLFVKSETQRIDILSRSNVVSIEFY